MLSRRNLNRCGYMRTKPNIFGITNMKYKFQASIFIILLFSPIHVLFSASYNNLLLGNEAFQKHHFFEAIMHYHNEEHEQGSTAVLAYNKGAAFYKLQKYQAAENHLQRAISLDANMGFAFFKLGQTQIKLDKLSVAKRNLEKAVELTPHSYAAQLAKRMLTDLNL